MITTTLLLLLALNNYRSECLTLLPDDSRRRPQPRMASRRHRGGGHPALLDAITNFSPSPPIVDACRVFHGRGRLHPGADHLTLDYYPPAFLLTSFRHLSEEELGACGDALGELWENNEFESLNHYSESTTAKADDGPNRVTPLTWVYQCRVQRGNSTTQLMSGEIPEPHVVTENDGRDKFIVHLKRGQNHGLFLDMAAGRAWLRRRCASGETRSVLNLFAYPCAFSVAALNGGAGRVVNVDMSRGALKIGQRNHDVNGLGKQGGRAKFLGHDLFKSWGKLKRLGPYDCVVVDPPSYQKGSFVAAKDYVKVIRRLPSLLSPEGWALLCLNAPELDTGFLLEQVAKAGVADELRFVERVENPSTFASAFPERALKVLVFQYRPSSSED